MRTIDFVFHVPQLISTFCYPEGFATLSGSAMQEATSAVRRRKRRETLPQRTMYVKVELPVGSVSALTLIRTDSTLDHSQKAEKVWYGTTLHFGGFGSFCVDRDTSQNNERETFKLERVTCHVSATPNEGGGQTQDLRQS